MTLRGAVVALGVGLCAAFSAGGLSAQESAGKRVVVSPSVKVLQALSDKEVRFLPQGISNSKGFVASLRFDAELSELAVRTLELAGVEFARTVSATEVDHIGSIYPAWVPWTALEWLPSFPGLRQIDSEYLRKPFRPLDVTRPLTGAPEVSKAIALASGLKPGQGIDIGDIDSGIDVFHPAFFNADAGYYSWLDVNQDGSYTAGIDAVDLNGDGVAGADEILALFDVGLINPWLEDGWSTVNGNGSYDVGYDILYVDSNKNGTRDYGTDAGYTDATPGFGEPMFVADDVNQDGKLDPTEKLVMLGSSKVAKLWVGKTAHVRGTDLSSVYSLETFGSDSSGYPTALHGTGVSGILVAGNPGLQRFVGMAPAANLHMYDNTHDDQSSWYDNSTLEKLVWAKNDGIDIMLYEFSMWGTTFMDGSSNLELAMDQIYEKNGILNVVPAGNLGGAGKHMSTTVATSGSQVQVNVPAMWPGYDGYAFESPGLILSFYWAGESDGMSFTLALPGGGSVDVPANSPQSGVDLGNNQVLYSYVMESAAGFSLQIIMVYDGDQKAVPTGDWTVGMKNNTGSALEVHGFLMDYVASWERTVVFKQFESDDSTMCHPSTAESAITVAAYGGEFGTAEELGKLRSYSSRGPRMDGDRGMDIGAPDDPYSALPEMEMGWGGSTVVKGAYMVFGGTSGAGPHVAGTLALLLQAHPEMSAPAWREALLDGTVAEAHMGTLPNKEWGFGKLNIYKAVAGQWPAPANQAPVALATVAWREGLYAGLSAEGSTDADGDALEYRWDFNYDGKWDTPWSPEGDIEYGAKEEGLVRIKLLVRDPKGAEDEYLLVYMADEQVIRPDEGGNPEPADDIVSEDSVVAPDAGDVASSDVAQDGHGTSDSVVAADTTGGDLVNEVSSSGGCAAASSPVSGSALLLALLCVLLAAFRTRQARSDRR